MPNFATTGKINIQPYDELGFQFEVTICSSVSANDGYIPYGTNVSTVNVIAYDKDDTVVTNDLISGTPSVATNIITVNLQYPSTNGVGRYKLTFQMTLDDGSKIEADFDRVYAVNK